MSEQSISKWWAVPGDNDYTFDWTFEIGSETQSHYLYIQYPSDSKWDFSNAKIDIPDIVSTLTFDSGELRIKLEPLQKTTAAGELNYLPAGKHTANLSGVKSPEKVGVEEIQLISTPALIFGIPSPINDDTLDVLFITDYKASSTYENSYNVQVDLDRDGTNETYALSTKELVEFFSPVLKYDDGSSSIRSLTPIFDQPAKDKDAKGNDIDRPEIFTSPIDVDSNQYNWKSRVVDEERQPISSWQNYSDSTNAVDLSEFRRKNVPNSEPVIYASVLDSSTIRDSISTPIPQDEVVINYWFHYPQSNWNYHGGVNDHQGDWEGISLFLNKTSGLLTPSHIAYAQHTQSLVTGGGEKVLWKDIFFQAKSDRNGISPIVYVGLGGHASYPYPGSTALPISQEEEFHRGNYDSVSPIVSLLPSTTSEDAPDWLRFPGYWGLQNDGEVIFNADIVLGGNDGPRGPAFIESGFNPGERWLNPWSWSSDFKTIDLNTTPSEVVITKPQANDTTVRTALDDQPRKRLEGSNNSDEIYGSDGDDDIYGKEGRNFIFPAEGEDFIKIEGGFFNRVFLGEDDDRDRIFIDLEKESYSVIKDFELGQDLLTFSDSPDIDIDVRLDSDGRTLSFYEPLQSLQDLPLGPFLRLKFNISEDSNPALSLPPQDNIRFRFTDGGEWYSTIPEGLIQTGSFSDDNLSGSEEASFIAGLEGDDTITTRVNNLAINAGPGNDIVFGSNSDQLIAAGDGDDSIYGEGGNDILNGDRGDDLISGGSGNDQIVGGSGNDSLEGGSGNDLIYGGAGVDEMVGGAGIDGFMLDPVASHPDLPSGDIPILLNGKLYDEINGELIEVNYLESGVDHVKDFEDGEDLIVSAIRPEFVSDALDILEDSETGNVQLRLKGEERVLMTLEGVSPEDISQDDFIHIESLDSVNDFFDSIPTDDNREDFPNVAPNSSDDFFATGEDTNVTGNVLVNDSDPDGDDLVAFLSSSPTDGSLTLETDGNFEYVPNTDFRGSDSFTYTVSDGELSATGTVNITVNPVNDAPVATEDSESTTEDAAVTIDVLSNDSDADSDSLSATLAEGPANGTVTTNADGSFKYTPDANFNGTDSFTYTVSDGTLSDTGTVNVDVEAVNDAPIATDDSGNTLENEAIEVDVLGNDTDVDGDTLSISALGDAANGSVAIKDGKIEYTPNDGFSGNDSFTYTVSDGELTDEGSVTVAVGAVNKIPEAVDDIAIGDEDTTIVGNVLDNDSDLDSDGLSAALETNPTNGSVTLNSDGSFEYTPDTNFNGSDSFTYSVSDGELTDTATVAVTVSPVNDAPIATEDSADVVAGESVTIDVLSNDTDIDSDGLVATLVDQPANGSVSVNSDGSFEYTPNDGFSGDDSFTYTVSDGGLSDSTTVSISVKPVVTDNTPPITVDDSATGSEDTVIIGNVLDNDSDPDGDALSAALGEGATNGTTTVNADGSFDYTPDADFNGADSFTYTASDGEDSATGTVNITVEATNDEPIAVDDSAITTVDKAVDINVVSNDSDADGDALSVDMLGAPANGSVNLLDNGSVTYTPNSGFSGSDSFTYTVSDGNGGVSNAATVNVSVSTASEGEQLVGTNGSNRLIGSLGDDRMFGRSGNDTLIGRDGDDRLVGGNDNDRIIGGAGNDDLIGGNGNDQILGGDGNDKLIGNSGRDRLLGGDGDDQLLGGNDDDVLVGNAGDDLLAGGSGDDRLVGGLGSDRLVGGADDDILVGGADDDYLQGSSGKDRLIGGSGKDELIGGNDNDQLVGESGDDNLFGQSGDDILRGGAGNDFLVGGQGQDIFVLERGAGTDTINDFKVGTDSIRLVGFSLGKLEITQSGKNSFLTLENETLAQLKGAVGLTISDLIGER